MSYGVSAALQRAVFEALSADADLAAIVGDAIYDAAPEGDLPQSYVTIGREEVRDRSDKTGRGARHDFTVSVVSEAAGFAHAKRAAGAISDALIDAPLTLSRGHLVSLTFLRATARRVGTGRTRRIDLRFRARVED
ncbi:MAG: DUF3168 domain-containing protein [Brevirhabdus sp.]